MSYQRKTIDRWDIMSNYGYGWECECSEYTYKEAKQTIKEYRRNTKRQYFTDFLKSKNIFVA